MTNKSPLPWVSALTCIVVAACAHEPVSDGTASPRTTVTSPGVGAPPAQTATAPKPANRVELAAVTLADDCGGTPPLGPPATIASATRAPSGAEADASDADHAKRRWDAKRRCEQTSMQLTIVATSATRLRVKSVELLDESGRSLGSLTASKPTRWSDAKAAYEPWDEQAVVGATSVSYVLSQPRWDQVADRMNRTFMLSVVVSVGGVDQTTRKDVYLSAPTSLGPEVDT